MKRRNFIQNSSMAALGTLITPSIYGSGIQSILDEKAIKKVHLIFKTHLDIGFTNLAENVISTYMNEFIPGALALSENMRKASATDRFVWTTGSWLIYKFLEQAAPEMRKRMEIAIDAGDIYWHGLPFTTHSELADPSLFELGIQLSANLDKRFDRKTISAKMTDVPGHTRGIVPILAKNGIEFLHIGVNPASMPPDVPPLFVWQAPDGSKVAVMYQKTYGSTMVIPDTQTAVAISFTGDNHGPQKPEEIAKIYNDLRTQFPNAEVVASTLNEVAKEVSAIQSKLPVITKELGDTWIHGAGSDPLKIAQFREISRLRTSLLKNKALEFGDKTDLAFGIPLLMVAEHTWGLDVKTWLKDWDVYKPADFNKALSTPKYKMMEKSWDEKRQYINDAIAQLPNETAAVAKEKIKKLKPVQVNKTGFKKIDITENEIDTHFFALKIDANTGGVVQLKDKTTGFDWANKNNPLCLFSYQTFSAADYDRYQAQYLTQKTDWALGDFGKTGQEIGNAVSKTWLPSLKDIFQKKDDKGVYILLNAVVDDENGKTVGGCARDISIELYFPSDKKEVHATLQWFNKSAYRLPEASWFSFIPTVPEGKWLMNKMGQAVDTRNVVEDGNRKLHAILDEVRFESNTVNCSLESLDTPLVAPGERNLLNFYDKLPENKDGMHFCLHNNVWGTNFMMWFGDDMKYRFKFKV